MASNPEGEEGVPAPQRGGETIELSLLNLVRSDLAGLECLRLGGVGLADDESLIVLAQFDVLSNLVAIDETGDASGRDFYTNFARFYSRRVNPGVRRLLIDPDMRRPLFKRADVDLALALQSVGALARKESWRFDGFEGWDQETNDFVATHLPG